MRQVDINVWYVTDTLVILLLPNQCYYTDVFYILNYSSEGHSYYDFEQYVILGRLQIIRVFPFVTPFQPAYEYQTLG